MAEKTKKYKVKSSVTLGVRNQDVADPTSPGAVTMKELKAGSSIDLTESQAREMAHALENPPAEKRAAGFDDAGDETFEELDEDEEEAVDSIRRRPDNPASGVQLHWKTDGLAVAAANRAASAASTKTKAVGGGFERANAGDPDFTTAGPGLNPAGIGPRPESNKTEMERAEEKKTSSPASPAAAPASTKK